MKFKTLHLITKQLEFLLETQDKLLDFTVILIIMYTTLAFHGQGPGPKVIRYIMQTAKQSLLQRL